MDEAWNKSMKSLFNRESNSSDDESVSANIRLNYCAIEPEQLTSTEFRNWLKYSSINYDEIKSLLTEEALENKGFRQELVRSVLNQVIKNLKNAWGGEHGHKTIK